MYKKPLPWYELVPDFVIVLNRPAPPELNSALKLFCRNENSLTVSGMTPRTLPLTPTSLLSTPSIEKLLDRWRSPPVIAPSPETPIGGGGTFGARRGGRVGVSLPGRTDEGGPPNTGPNS